MSFHSQQIKLAVILIVFRVGYDCQADLTGFIIGGEAVTDNTQFPFMVALMSGKRPFCGGAIYSPKVIITAAHCVDNMKPLFVEVRVGAVLRKFNGLNSKVASIILHPRYVRQTFQNDIALLILKGPLEFSNTVNRIELVKTTPHHKAPAIVIGFGRVHELEQKYPNHLQYTQLKVISREKCASKRYEYGKINVGAFCALEKGKDTCEGDSGGPLLVNGELAGITSAGPDRCSKASMPGIYTDVAYYREWIIQNAERNN